MAGDGSRFAAISRASTRTSSRRGGRGARGAGGARCRSQGGDGRANRAARATGPRQAADHLPRSGRPTSRARASRCRRRGTARSPAARFRPICSASGFRGPGRPRSPTPRRGEHPQRRVRAAVGRRRLDVRRRGRARPGVDDVARQPAEPEARDPPRPRVPDRRRAGGRRDEPLGAASSSAATIIDDWRTQLDFTTKMFRPRGLHLDDRHIRHADGSGFSASIVDATLYVVNNHQALARSNASLVLYLPKIQTAEEAALWNDILSALEAHLGLADGADQGLRARRAARSVLPADGNPRGARQALHRLQHRPLGLHQQRRPTRWRGIRRSSTPTSTRSR